MKHVLILSDSHGLTDELSIIKDRHEEVDYFIHCGDSELTEDTTYLSGYSTVSGNCDWNGTFPDELTIQLGGLTFLIVHGHLFGVKESLLNLQYRAHEVGADIVCYGHSHIPFAEKTGEHLFMNPGSIRLPKKYPHASYVIISWNNSDNVQVQFYKLNGEKLENLPYSKEFAL